MRTKKFWVLSLILAMALSLGAAFASVFAEPTVSDWAKNESGGAVTTITPLENGWKISSALPASTGTGNAESTAVLQLPLNLSKRLSFQMKINYNRTAAGDATPDRAFVMGINGAKVTDPADSSYFSQFMLKTLNPSGVSGFQTRFSSESSWLSAGAPEATSVAMFYQDAGGAGNHQLGAGGNCTGTAGDATLRISDMRYNGATVQVTVEKTDSAYELRFDGVGKITGGWGWGSTGLSFDIPADKAGFAADENIYLAFSFLNWNSNAATTMGVEVTDFTNADYSLAFDQAVYTMNGAESTLDLSEKLTVTDLATGGASDEKVTWSSSDAAVAEVSQEGVVTAKKGGSALITATLEDGTKAVCTVEVRIPVTAGWAFAEGSYLAAYEAENGTRIVGEIPAPAAGQTATLKDMAVITQRMKPASKISFDLSVRYDGAEANRWFAICFNRAAVTDGLPSMEDMNVSAIGGMKQSGFQITVDAAPSWAGVYTATNIAVYGYKGQYGDATIPSGDTVNSEFAQHFWSGEAIRIEIVRTETAYTVTMDDQTITVPHTEISADGDFAAADEVFLGFKMFNGTDTAAAVDFTVSDVQNGVMAGLTLDKTEIALSKDAPEATLTASIQWKDGADHTGADETITWFSSDFSVVEVNGGALKAKAAGTAKITAMTSEGDTAVCTVTVTWQEDDENGSSGNNTSTDPGTDPSDEGEGGCSGGIGLTASVAAAGILCAAAVALVLPRKRWKQR